MASLRESAARRASEQQRPPSGGPGRPPVPLKATGMPPPLPPPGPLASAGVNAAAPFFPTKTAATVSSNQDEETVGSWEECYDRKEMVRVGQDNFAVYRSDGPAASAGAVVWLIHGGGLSSLSFALVARQLRGQFPVVACDLRGHGETECAEPGPLSTEQMTTDLVNVIGAVLGDQTPKARVVLVGHSLGGALGVRLASSARSRLPVDVIGCVVVDVVEGTALHNLRYMRGMLEKRPVRFASLQAATDYVCAAGGIKNPESAKISVHGQVKEDGTGGYVWRTDLLCTEAHWEGWFLGLSQEFLAAPCPKLLMAAGTDRLDKELTMAQMMGKFQFAVVYGTGHHMAEDNPKEVASHVSRFVERFSRAPPAVR
eukprot:Hpha_TRINITY_DN1755_c0_g1::TRINITY_DN1755_c0_g1_i1::g.158437::m.158437/K13617/PPME1; protein phosphatase methylesterase 1